MTAVAAFLAEVDVEVRHRHAFGVEEALEQQVEADRIEVGDGQRPGGDRTGAGAAAGTDGNAVRLRPLDEVGDDQEVAGETHRGDDAEFVVQPFAIARARCGIGAHRVHAAIEALDRHGAHGFFLGAAGAHLRRNRQQRLARLHHHRAAPRDRERVVAGLRQVGEQHAHVGRGLEPVLRRDAAAIRFRQQAPLGDAQQRVVRLVHVGRGEVAVVGGDQRDAGGIGQRDQPGFDAPVPAAGCGGAVPSRRDRETLRPSAASRRSASGFWPSASRRASGPVVPPVSRIRPAACSAIVSNGELRLQAGIGVEEAARRQALQVAQPGRVLRQQHERIGRQARIVGAGQRDLAADDRLDALGGAGLAELQRAEQVGGVGDGDRRHAGLARQGGDLVHLDGALAERIGGMDAQMDEIGVGHGKSM